MVEQRLSLITLGVADLGRARSFYEALGWTTAAEPDADVVFFQAGGMVIALCNRPGATTFWGGYSGVFLDPDGHPWEVAHNLGWTLHDDGSISLPS